MDPDVRDFSLHYFFGSVGFDALVREKTHARELGAGQLLFSRWAGNREQVRECRREN